MTDQQCIEKDCKEIVIDEYGIEWETIRYSPLFIDNTNLFIDIKE